MNDNTLLVILLLACIALLAALLLLRRRKTQRDQIQRDRSGLWRYHKETGFERTEALGDLSEKKDRTSKKKKNSKVIVAISFDGDIKAKQHKMFAKQVDEIELNREQIEEVVVSITSPGGMVSQYGHAYTQMERIRGLDLKLTVCIDIVAASGGYLLSLPANKIIAAPFALVGSVGVLAMVPNVRRFLTNLNVEPRVFSAGKFKHTISLFDQANPGETEHFQNQLHSVHRLFISAVKKYRENADIGRIETGDHWTAQESLELDLNLVDELGSSQEYLLAKNREFDLVRFTHKRSFLEEHFGRFSTNLIDRIEERLYRFAAGMY